MEQLVQDDVFEAFNRLLREFRVELKVDKFKPEDAGKLAFYVSAFDAQVRSKQQAATTGILFCKSKSDIKVEYSSRHLYKPIGVSEYQNTASLSNELRSSLPTTAQIEADLESVGSQGRRILCMCLAELAAVKAAAASIASNTCLLYADYKYVDLRRVKPTQYD